MTELFKIPDWNDPIWLGRVAALSAAGSGSESMPGNVSLAIDGMLSTLQTMKARVDGAHDPQ